VVNDTVLVYGAALLEALFNRTGRWRTQQWCTSIVNLDPDGAQLIDIVGGRAATPVLDWLDEQPDAWKDAIRWGVLNLSGPYRKVFAEGLGHVTQVADPFHLVKLANSKLVECRRRVQNDTLGHRGRKTDPRYRAPRLLTKAHERLDERGETRLRGLLDAGDPKGEVRTAWHAKEVARSIYGLTDPDLARDSVAPARPRPARRHLPTRSGPMSSHPAEIRRAGITLVRHQGTKRSTSPTATKAVSVQSTTAPPT
jgi:transposase